MSTRNRKLPPPVEPDLPALDPASQTSIDNALADVDANYVPPMTDEYMDTAPEEVINGLDEPEEIRRAEPVPQGSGGTRFDFSAFSPIVAAAEAGDMEAARKLKAQLSPVQQHVLERASYTKEYSAEQAAADANAFIDLQTKTQMQAQDPIRQARLDDVNSKIAERKSVQNDFKVRRENTIKAIDEILADKDYRNLVGPIDGTVGAAYDSLLSPSMQTKRARLDRLINIDVLDMTKYLRPISQDELKYLRTLVPSQRQHWEVYEQYLKEKRDTLKAADKALINPATNQPLMDEASQGAAQTAAPQGQGAPPRANYQVGKSYRDNQGRVGIFTGYNPDGLPAFSRPGR